MRDRSASSSTAAPSSADPSAAPGKRTLTERLAVQRRAVPASTPVPMLALQLRQETSPEAADDPFGMHLLDTELSADEVPADYHVSWEDVSAAAAGSNNDALD